MKYCISCGSVLGEAIREVEATVDAHNPNIIREPPRFEKFFTGYEDVSDSYNKPFWHETFDEAVAQAEFTRKHKIEALEKMIEKLKAVDFRKQL